MRRRSRLSKKRIDHAAIITQRNNFLYVRHCQPQQQKDWVLDGTGQIISEAYLVVPCWGLWFQRTRICCSITCPSVTWRLPVGWLLWILTHVSNEWLCLLHFSHQGWSCHCWPLEREGGEVRCREYEDNGLRFPELGVKESSICGNMTHWETRAEAPKGEEEGEPSINLRRLSSWRTAEKTFCR